MTKLDEIPLMDERHRTVLDGPAYRCVVEAPRGSTVKWKYEPELRVFVMGKALVAGLSYPYDWGFLPSTRGEDGDPLDVMIVHDSTATMGVVIPVQIIGVLVAVQSDKGEKKSERNDRFFAVPVSSHRQDVLNDVDELGKRVRSELEAFFVATSALQGRKIEFTGWSGPKRAEKLIAAGQRRFEKR